MNLSIGTKVRLARLGKGWTLQEVATKTTYSIAYLSKVEHDIRPPPEIVLQLLEVSKYNWYGAIVHVLKCHSDSAAALISPLNKALKIVPEEEIQHVKTSD